MNFHLTNRFHVAAYLSSSRSKTSKCGKNKKVAPEPFGKHVTDVLSTFLISSVNLLLNSSLRSRRIKGRGWGWKERIREKKTEEWGLGGVEGTHPIV